MDRKKLTKIATDTLKIIKEGYYLNGKNQKVDIKILQKLAERDTVSYNPAVTDDLIQDAPKNINDADANITVTTETTLDAARRLIKEDKGRVVCLNFASGRHPGGGFLNGSRAQEESIARSTGLYNCLMKAPEYYKENRSTKSCIYTDYMIYSPDVPMIKDERGKVFNTVKVVSVITSPAVNLGAVKKAEPEKVSEVEVVMRRRIEKILAIADYHNYPNIILGAWGCGVFQNDPEDVALWFREIIENKFMKSFKNIVFAVYAGDDKFIKPFIKEFE